MIEKGVQCGSPLERAPVLGEIQEAVRPVMLTGNLFQTLNNLDGVGNDLGMNQGGGCGKGGQSPLPVSNGSPHIRIQKCLISGA